ncbi:MAG: hypothetical protein LAO08_20150 [Acidobacteriia bacterium]|nr:hypothetical protein [Terriglobia bacterium]
MKPPLDYLLGCSGTSLRDFELSRLNEAANLRKEILAIEDDLRQAQAEAVLARWLMEHREELLSAGVPTVFQGSFEFTAAPPERELYPALPPPALPKKKLLSSAEAKRRASRRQENVA